MKLATDKQHQSANILAEQPVDVFEHAIHHRPAFLLDQAVEEILAHLRAVLEKKERQNRNQDDVDDVLRAGDKLASQALDVWQNVLASGVQFILQHLGEPGADRIEPSGKRNLVDPFAILEKIGQPVGQVVGFVGQPGADRESESDHRAEQEQVDDRERVSRTRSAAERIAPPVPPAAPADRRTGSQRRRPPGFLALRKPRRSPGRAETRSTRRERHEDRCPACNQHSVNASLWRSRTVVCTLFWLI